eukprot:3537635-Amphidinium_carterae.3
MDNRGTHAGEPFEAGDVVVEDVDDLLCHSQDRQVLMEGANHKYVVMCVKHRNADRYGSNQTGGIEELSCFCQQTAEAQPCVGIRIHESWVQTNVVCCHIHARDHVASNMREGLVELVNDQCHKRWLRGSLGKRVSSRSTATIFLTACGLARGAQVGKRFDKVLPEVGALRSEQKGKRVPSADSWRRDHSVMLLFKANGRSAHSSKVGSAHPTSLVARLRTQDFERSWSKSMAWS